MATSCGSTSMTFCEVSGMAKCNIDAIAGAEIMSRFQTYLTGEEEDQVKEKFTGLCFYESFGQRGYRECFCTKCEQLFGIEKGDDRKFFENHHNDWTCCPFCREEVQLKSLGRIKNFSNLRESIPAAFIRVNKDGALLISAGIATRCIPGWNDLGPQVEFTEKARYYLEPGRVIGWKRSINYYFSMVMGPCPWMEMKNICKPFQNNALRGYSDTYWLFGTEKLADSSFRYCQLEEWYHAETQSWLCEQDTKVRMCVEYLAKYALHPQMEMAVKLGLTKAATDLCEGRKNHVDLNWNADKPWEFLRLSRPDAKAFLACPSLKLLHWIHQEQKAGGGMKVPDMIQLWNSLGGSQAQKLASCALRCGVSARRALHYVESWPGGSKSQGAELWYDYLDMARKLEYDLSRPDVLMPKNLRERHDAAAQTLRLVEDAKAAKVYAKRLKMLREKYEFELDGLRIVVPESARQIVEEGKTLKHCVGGYAGRHIEGKTVILFLRRSRRPERSLVTIEMCGFDNNDIQQIHGYRNELGRADSPFKKYGTFLTTWLDWIRGGSKRDSKGRPVLPAAKDEGVA